MNKQKYQALTSAKMADGVLVSCFRIISRETTWENRSEWTGYPISTTRERICRTEERNTIGLWLPQRRSSSFGQRLNSAVWNDERQEAWASNNISWRFCGSRSIRSQRVWQIQRFLHDFPVFFSEFNSMFLLFVWAIHNLIFYAQLSLIVWFVHSRRINVLFCQLMFNFTFSVITE